MAAIDRDRVDQLHTESFSWKLIIAEDQKVIDRTLLRWKNSNGFVDPQCHRGTDRASSGSDAQGAYYIILEDQKVIDRTLLRWRNSNDFVNPQCHRGFDSALTIHCWI